MYASCNGTGDNRCTWCKGMVQVQEQDLQWQSTAKGICRTYYHMVYPIMHAPDEAVRNASSTFTSKHSTAFPNERILKQQHNLRLTPIAEVNYMWKEKTGAFYVYGYEHKVYFDSYPQKCCCCSII